MLALKGKKAGAWLRLFIPFFGIPLLALLSVLLFEGKRHLIFSLFAAVFSLFLFFTGFEEKRTGSRRLVLVAVMTALSVMGRFIPFFKPVAALSTLSGMYLGREAGFLVGALSALLSNFYFGQGPWTPFQMLAWGLIGFFAGVLSSVLKKHRPALLSYGVLTGILFSMLMDVFTVLWMDDNFSFALYGAALLSALPYTALYAVSNFLFLLWLGEPFGRKFTRIQLKYDI